MGVCADKLCKPFFTFKFSLVKFSLPFECTDLSYLFTHIGILQGLGKVYTLLDIAVDGVRWVVLGLDGWC